ncbi:MAG: DMT family transporter [bacterium]|nr:DMT family transporter [bacterium]
MHTKGVLLVLTTSIISGFSIFLNKWGAPGIEPCFFTFAKNFLTAIFLTGVIFIIYRQKDFKKITSREWLSLILVGLIGGSIPFLLFFKGLSLTSATAASFFHKTMFIWLIPISWIFLKKKINIHELIAGLVMLSGSVLYFQYKMEQFNRGDLLILAAAILWAFEIALSKKLLSRLSGFTVAWGRMFFGAIFIFLFLLARNKGLDFNFAYSPWQYFWIILSAIILFGYVATFYNGLKYVSAFTAAAIMTIAAPLTALLSFIFIDQAIMPLQVIAMAVIFLGLHLLIFQNKLWPKTMFLKK